MRVSENKRTLARLGLGGLLPLVLASACSHPIDEELHVNFVNGSPLEVDIVPDDTDGDGALSGYIAEEISVDLSLDRSPNLTDSQQRHVQIDSYSLTYTPLNGSGTIPSYLNGTSIYLAAGDQGSFPIRAVSFVQKDAVRETFGADAAVNATATLTLSGTILDEDEPFDIVGSFDIIFANFAETTN